MSDKSEMEELDEWARSIADKDWENVVKARSHVIRLAAEIVTKCCSKKDQEWREAVKDLIDALEEIAIEQKFFIKEKDYFSEVVRLNLTAKEALSDFEAKVGK